MQHVYDFIDKVKPVALQVERVYGIPHPISIAQAALETGWGRHVKGNNYFGIKGAGQSFATHEYVDGKRVEIVDSFRKYASLEDSWMDYGKFLRSNPRYSLVFQRDTVEDMVREIHSAGYATDPEYSKKILSIIRRWGLGAGEFPDVSPGHWAEEAITWASRNGILGGYPDGTFQPGQNVTRAELCVILHRLALYVEGKG